MDPVVVTGYLLIAAAVILLLLILGGFVWMGWELMQREDAERHAPIAEPPTLDVQNHLGDDAAIRRRLEDLRQGRFG